MLFQIIHTFIAVEGHEFFQIHDPVGGADFCRREIVSFFINKPVIVIVRAIIRNAGAFQKGKAQRANRIIKISLAVGIPAKRKIERFVKTADIILAIAAQNVMAEAEIHIKAEHDLGKVIF